MKQAQGLRRLKILVPLLSCLIVGVLGQVDDGGSRMTPVKVNLRGAGSITFNQDPGLKPEQESVLLDDRSRLQDTAAAVVTTGEPLEESLPALTETMSTEVSARLEYGNPAKAPPLRPRVAPVTVAFLTVLMALATGLGSLPFFFFDMKGRGYAGICNGMACGVMLAASFGLLHEGESFGGAECVIAGILLGGLFILASQKVRDKPIQLIYLSLEKLYLEDELQLFMNLYDSR
jgi:hypothetical protein